MTFLLSNWRTLAALALIIACGIGCAYMGISHTTAKYELQITTKELADAKAREMDRIENEKSIAKLQGEKYAAQKRIGAIAGELADVRVLLMGCGGELPVPNDPATTPGGDTQATAGGKPLPDTAESPQRALDTFMASSDNAARDADTVVSECRVVYEWARSIKNKSGD